MALAIESTHLAQICRGIETQALNEGPTNEDRRIAIAICNELLGPCHSTKQSARVAQILASGGR